MPLRDKIFHRPKLLGEEFSGIVAVFKHEKPRLAKIYAALVLQEAFNIGASEVPDRTGAYQSGWRIRDTVRGAMVINDAPHAGVIEFGRKSRATPPLDNIIEWMMTVPEKVKEIHDLAAVHGQDVYEVAKDIAFKIQKTLGSRPSPGKRVLQRAIMRIPGDEASLAIMASMFGDDAGKSTFTKRGRSATGRKPRAKKVKSAGPGRRKKVKRWKVLEANRRKRLMRKNPYYREYRMARRYRWGVRHGKYRYGPKGPRGRPRGRKPRKPYVRTGRPLGRPRKHFQERSVVVRTRRSVFSRDLGPGLRPSAPADILDQIIQFTSVILGAVGRTTGFIE